MIKDFNDSAVGKMLEADVCVVGAGAAGITIAHALMNKGLDVLVLESGGQYPDKETTDLNTLTVDDDIDANVTGTRFNPNRACRQRFFGGTTNHWTGWCRPLDEIDFKARSWIPQSGWPISRSDLEPYYQAAKPYCDLQNPIFTAAKSGLDNLPNYLPNKLESIFWSFSAPTRFGQKYRAELEASANVTVLLHANVVDIVTDSLESTVSALTVRSLNGKQSNIRASRYIVATGALENTRLLLASNKINPAGVGNQSGMVGKNYQNHPHLDVGTIVSSDPQALSALYERRPPSGQGDNGFRLGIGATEDIQQERGTLNFAASFQEEKAKKIIRTMWNDIKRFNWPNDFSSKMKTVVEDLVGQEERLSHQVYMYTEQAPNNDSRIALTDERDALDMPRIRMDWKLNDLDKHTVKQASLVIGEEVGRLGIGRLNIRDWIMQSDGKFPSSLWGGCHQIGTTRMSASADDGVVDKNCRVHGVDNLYLAGSSVFPTGGHTPPTFTIVALALRLADHLVEDSTQPKT